MIIISAARTVNIINECEWCSKIVIDDSRVTLKIVVPLTDNSRGVMYDHNMFIVQATCLIFAGKAKSLPMRYAPLRQAQAWLSNLKLV